MVFIITGPRNAGKTTYLLKLSKTLDKKDKDGFVMIKLLKGKEILGYNLYDLHTQKSTPIIRLKDWTLPGWQEIYSLGKFSFSRAGILRGKEIIKRAMKRKVKAVFIDEIGKLELEGKGFYKVFKELCLKQERFDIYVGCRENFVSLIVQKFDIKNFKIVKP